MLVLALAACSAVAQPRVYVLCVGEAGQGWVDKYAFTRAFTYELSAVNETWEVVVIEDVEDWGRLVEEAPEGVVVVNGHGEVMPLPASYADIKVLLLMTPGILLMFITASSSSSRFPTSSFVMTSNSP